MAIAESAAVEAKMVMATCSLISIIIKDSIQDAKTELELTESSRIHETPNLVIPRRFKASILRARNKLLQRLSQKIRNN